MPFLYKVRIFAAMKRYVLVFFTFYDALCMGTDKRVAITSCRG